MAAAADGRTADGETLIAGGEMMPEESIPLEEFPTTLGELVRRNRDRLEVGLATEAELASVTGDLESRIAPVGRIDDWRVVALRDRTVAQTSMHIIGRFQKTRARMTSDIAVLTPDRACVRTRNSLYMLGEQATGEPDLILLLHVAAVLHWWGVDRQYDLGIVPVYY
jgi:hypothetical protein